MDIYTSQYTTFKGNSSDLDRKLRRITKIYEGFNTEGNETPLLAEDINLTKVGDLIKLTPSKVTSSDKAKQLLKHNIGRLEETTDQMLDMIATLDKIRTDWIRLQSDVTVTDVTIKKNVKWMTDRGAEWQDFSAILEQGLEQLRTISQWQTLEREQRISGRDRDERPQHNREREWRAPNFNAPILPDEPNPNQFKQYREDMVSWFNAGGPDCPRTMARALLIKDLPESIRGKISDKITTKNSLKRNLEIIEEFIL